MVAANQSKIASALAGMLAAVWMLTPAISAEFRAGNYSFSDELGGFRLVSASGSGTPEDPAVLVEEFPEAAPVTLVIRRFGKLAGPSRDTFAPLTVIKVVTNRSNRVWAGFEVELQEILKQPSVYYDGLSFNQFGVKPPDVTSDAFAKNERLFEPYDRIQFNDGHVDPDATARFRLTITDPTPVAQFYLVQDPKLLSAALPGARSLAFAPGAPRAGY